jgi:RNA polymerase sigma-70 factor (ECF subfamily)
MTAPDSEFERLMARVRGGCAEAARELFNQYSEQIRLVVRRRLNDRLRRHYDSLDFLQEVWASFFAVPPERFTFASPVELVRFLSRVAYNKVVETVRRRATRKWNLTRERCVTDFRPPLRLEQLKADERQPTPSQVAIANEKWERLLRGQPAHCRRILELLRQGHGQTEIARELCLPLKAIQRLLSRLTDRQGPQ